MSSPIKKSCIGSRSTNKRRNRFTWHIVGLIAVMPSLVCAAAYDDLKPGEWKVVSLNTISDVNPCQPNGPLDCGFPSGSQKNLIAAWNGGAFATGFGTRGGYIVWGGGHGDYYGNEIYVFDIDTQRWARQTDPVTYPSCNHSVAELQDGSPCIPHTYEYIDYHPGSNSLVKLGSIADHECGGCGSPMVHLFSFDTNTWRRGQPHNGLNNTGASSAYDPNRDAFWLLGAYGTGLAKYDPDANGGGGQWTDYNNYNIAITATSEIDPIRDLFVTLESRSSHSIIVHDLNNPSTGGVTVPTTGDNTVAYAYAPGFEWDPVRKKFVAWGGGTSVYTLTPPSGDWRTQTWVWEKVAVAATNTVDPGAQSSNGTYGRWQYVPSVDAFIVVSDVNAPTYMFKMPGGSSASDTTGPSTPTNLSATAASSSQINLFWGASTDNVGVVGYKIYRGGSYLTSVTTTNYSNTGLTAGATYTYTVSAHDAAGNESAQSSSASATTQSASDSAPPVCAAGSPSGTLPTATKQANLSLSTNENAICRFSTAVGQSYASMASTFATTGGTSHSQGLTSLSDGMSYTYYVRCQDTSGNTNTKDYAISFNIASPGQTTDDFATLCSDSDVVLCDPLDSQRVSGVSIDATTPNATLPEALAGQYRDWRWAGNPYGCGFPSYDSTLGSGTGSLKFAFPSQCGAGQGGFLQTNFTPDNSVQFGENETFYVRWKQRFSCDAIYTDCDPASPTYKQERRNFQETSGMTGFKTIIINHGDNEHESEPASSCTWQHLVLNHSQDHRIAGYHSCGWYEAWQEPTNGGNNYDLQPGGDNSCMWKDENGNRYDWGNIDPNCVQFEADEWMTFQLEFAIGSWQPDRTGTPESNVRLWVTRESGQTVQVLDYPFYNRGAESDAPWRKYGKVWLLNYMTAKDDTEIHPEGYTWYDELVVSRSRVADPKDSAPDLLSSPTNLRVVSP